MGTISVITTLEKIEPNDDYLALFGDQRVVGWYPEYSIAVEAVRENRLDINEEMYDYAVVEEMEPGLYPNVVQRQFFEYDRNSDSYLEIEEPECVKQIVNFGIG